jgi:hypothetical protein
MSEEVDMVDETKKQNPRSPSKKRTTGTVKKKAAGKAAVKRSTVKKAARPKTTADRNRRLSAEGRRSEDKVMPGLLQNLQGVFDKIYKDNRDQDRARDLLVKDLNIHLQRSFKSMHRQLEEREKLLDRKLKGIDRSHTQELKRVKLLSVPLAVISLVAIVYLFYVVRVMEVAMSSMSQDMKQMTAYMETITDDTHALSFNTAMMVTKVDEMNSQMAAMNGSVYYLRGDMHQMTRSVSPAMTSFNRFMP